ncbi:hypothetical protein [Salinispora arenicola]|uniref:hypothetical protein n=1 Tax=Salinispora arenicola TaxID=168697 RepID=UPI0012BD5FA6|nr:hypothetical protein [Salinispora arenicola]
MQSRVDVWLAGRVVDELNPPPNSIIDGGVAINAVRTCCLRRYGLSRLAVILPVDSATAKQFARTCRMETIWWRKVVPSGVAAVALIVMVNIVDSIFNDEAHILWTTLIALILAFVVTVGGFALDRLRSPYHPSEIKGDVYIRGVDREVAEIWMSLNPIGAIRIIEK